MTLSELGSVLQKRREELGFSIDDISERIKVSMRIIRLIEEGNTLGLPHSVYTRGFIISYSEVLQIDREELMAALDQIYPSEDLEEVHVISQPLAPAIGRNVRIKQIIVCLVLLLAVGIAVAGGWFVINKFGQDVVDFVRQPFGSSTEAQQPAPAGPQESAGPVAATQAPAAPQVDQSGHQSVQMPSETVTLPQSTTQSTSNAVEHSSATAASSGNSATQAVTDNVAQIMTKAPCWTRVIADGKQLPDITIIPGKDFTFQYKEKAAITFGNPSAVILTVNGEPYAGSLKSSTALTISLP